MISTIPGSRVWRVPKRITSRSEYRTDSVPITSVTGRKARPISSAS
jgi:hypothetical protein